IPEYGLYLGKASGSAMPLVWAHSEYIKLCRSLKAKKIFDMPSQTRERYLENKTGSDLIIWNFSDKYKYFPKGKIVRVQCHASAKIKWTSDDWNTCNEVVTFDTGVGVHYADLATAHLDREQKIKYTFYWHEAEIWENKDYELTVEKEPAAQSPSEPEKEQAERDKIKVFLPS
ncbi:MAG: glucan 1,4-alpha-glucosidase, partial [Bacteroidia bacterium]